MIKSFSTLKEAIEDIAGLDSEYRLLMHKFSPGTEIGMHYHPKVSEWVIVDSGKFNLFYGGSWVEVEPKNEVLVISLEPGEEHSLKVLSETTYIVVRSGEAETIFTK